MTSLAAAAGRLRTHRVAVAVFILLAVIHTWPLATNPAALSLNDNGDTMLNEWILAWVVHQLGHDPLNLFDGNIFHPAKDTLAYSEPLIVPALLGAPVFWAGGSPVLAFNLLLLAGLALTGLATYALLFKWTADRFAALAAGSLFAFNTHTLTRLPHLQAIHAYGFPLALLFTDTLIRQPKVSAAIGLAAAMSLMVYTSGYLVVFATLSIALALVVRIPEWKRNRRRVLGGFALATVLTGVVTAPVVLTYRRVAVEQGMVRSVENVRQFSATPAGYLAATGRVHHATWSARFYRNPVDTFFPGVVAVLCAAFGVWHGLRAPHRSRVMMAVAIGVTGFVLSLGIRTPVYEWLFAVFPPMQGLRAAARFGNLFLLAMAILAGVGIAALRQAQSGRRWIASLSVATVALVNVEALRAPFDYQRYDGIPRLYAMLAMEPTPVVLAETPVYPAHAAFQNAEYMLNSTAHWRPLLNGYSGYTPASYRQLAWILWYFPREHAIAEMRKAGVTHFTVHPNRLGSKSAEVIETLSRRPDVELLAIAAGRGIRLYRFK